MSRSISKNEIKLQAKRNVELWIYSFADMYMILSVFFIALAVLYAAKVKQSINGLDVPTAGRGPASVVSTVQLDFQTGSSEIDSNAMAELKLFLPVIKAAPDSGRVMIEGYASGLEPLDQGTGFTSVLDLSTRRAVSVAEWLIKNGVAASKVQTFSFADGKLRKTETDQKGTDSHRVVIKLASLGDQG